MFSINHSLKKMPCRVGKYFDKISLRRPNLVIGIANLLGMIVIVDIPLLKFVEI